AIRGGVAVLRDVTERKRSEELLRERERHFKELAERNRLLVQEVEHRVRNNLAGLLGVVSVMRGKASDVNSFADDIESRIAAMTRIHEAMAEAGWRSVSLQTLVKSSWSAMRRLTGHPIEVQ